MTLGPRFVSSRNIAQALRWSLWCNAFSVFPGLALQLAGTFGLDPSEGSTSIGMVFGGLFHFLMGSSFFVFVASFPVAIFLLCVWHHRVEVNANTLGLTPPVNAVFGALSWLLPVVNLVVPNHRLYSVRRLYAPLDRSRETLWTAWWLTQMAYFGILINTVAFPGAGLGRSELLIASIGLLVTVLFAILTIAVVRDLTACELAVTQGASATPPTLPN